MVPKSITWDDLEQVHVLGFKFTRIFALFSILGGKTAKQMKRDPWATIAGKM